MIYSFTVVRRAPSVAFDGEIPYVVAIVALDEGPHLMSRIVGSAMDQVHIGMKVDVRFEEVDAEIALPVFSVRQ